MVEEVTVDASDIEVDGEAFNFLRLQKGKLDPLVTDWPKWLAAYRAGLQNDYQGMKPFLPILPQTELGLTLVDIGSGLGGIDILLQRHYEGRINPVLVDGAKDKPVMKFHRNTFNSMQVASRFHERNGNPVVQGIDANMRELPALSTPAFLVISLGAWCFHLPPDLYLDWVLRAVRKGSVLILDVRKDKPEWSRQLAAAFEVSKKPPILDSKKFQRTVYYAR